ncbi:hypothetical protein EYA84_23420 [Verrucosispora sp. SN26_14.1]|uniref:hypothetical protein n=1 Tax=Verrucosispora sp. SN26_14.1 TaxID=2527879 RepID=UPI0010341018|nr:hypothetical protein [Verrucosispora sp. SN26_14.1]TBL30043.1 hypothetical protein EYA84_23420 [Verrucosispora sp. SN26_14.1]
MESFWEESPDEYPWDELDEIDDSSAESQPPVQYEVMALAEEHPAYIVLAGGQSGTVVSTPPAGSITRAGLASAIPTRDQALDGRRPLFLYHAGQPNFAQGREVLSRLHANHGSTLGLGVVTSLPRHVPNKIADVFNCQVAAVRIADPEGFWADRGSLVLENEDPAFHANANAGQAAARRAANMRQRAPYLDLIGQEGFVEEVVAAQRLAGANVVLTSGRALSPSRAARSIAELIDEGDHVHSLLRSDERMALNITLPHDFMTNRPLAELLLAELLERDQFDTWYVRGQWRYNEAGPVLRDPDVLTFYKEISNLAEEEERKLIFPQSGLTGWYFLAHGARGFGTGTTGAQQAFVQYRPFARQKNITDVQRIFERALIHSIEFETHLSLLSQRGHVSCDCRWCEAVHQTGAYNKGTLQWHTLYAQGQLCAAAKGVDSAGGARAAVRRIVRRAQQFREQQSLLGKDDPKHLTNWLQLL